MTSAIWDGIEFLGSMESEDGSPKLPPTSMTRCLTTDLPLEETFDRMLTTVKQNSWENEYANGLEVRSMNKNTLEGGMRTISSTTLIRCEQYPTADFTLTFTSSW